MLSLRRGTVKSRTSRALERLRAQTGGEPCLSSSAASARSATRSPGPRHRSRPASSRRAARVSGWRPLAIGAGRCCWPCSPACSRCRPAPEARFSRSSAFAARRSSVWRSCRRSRPALDLGRRVSREEAERLVGFRLVDLGRRTGSTCETTAPPRSSTDRRRSLASSSPSAWRLWEGFVKKVGSTGTRVEYVTVNGERGLFVSGAQHFVMFLDEQRRCCGRPDLPGGHGAPLESRPAAAPAGRRSDARRGARAGASRSQ